MYLPVVFLKLVRKNMFILTTNICGLETKSNVNDLWKNQAALMNNVFDDVLEVQQYLTGKMFNRDQLLSSALTAFEADPEHIVWVWVGVHVCTLKDL